ncbi:hypothetical protein SH139x_005731 [Planctomycetaceae bacterium SH139]
MNLNLSPQTLEIGIVLAGKFDAADQRAANEAVRVVRDRLQDWFPQFVWKLELARRPDWGGVTTAEPTDWLLQAAEERDANRWDFALAITNVDLQGHYRSFAYAAVSRSLDAAVVSTLRIDPDQSGMELDSGERVHKIAGRLARLLLHSVGHLNGLKRQADRENLMAVGITASDFDGHYDLDEEQHERLTKTFEEVADVRLEEHGAQRRQSRLRFILKAIWWNRSDILKSIAGARPWEFPRRLSRLTTAAVSTLAILMMTAEAWDLGLSQSAYQLLLLACSALLATSWYVAYRQQLLIHRFHLRTEQTVSTQTASLGIVAMGMATMWLVLAMLSMIFSVLLFENELIAQWAGEDGIEQLVGQSSHGREAIYRLYFRMASFVASIGVLIGALGTSFESQHHFRHIVFVDEEI